MPQPKNAPLIKMTWPGQPPPSPPPLESASYGERRRGSAMFVILGILCAIVALFILPEIFGSAAIILGAYAWKREGDNPLRSGVYVIVLGILCMFVGIYFTSYFGLYNFLPQ